MHDQEAHVYGLSYYKNGRLWRVTLPDNALGQHLETFYSFQTVDSSRMRGTMTDVRGKNWSYLISTANHNVLEFANPLSQTTVLTYATSPAQNIHEVASVRDPLNHTSTYTYDANGNMLTAADALGNTTFYTFDSLNNLRTITPAGETPGTGNPYKMVEVFYDDSAHPTSPTRIVEPPDGRGNPAATTEIVYYGDDEETGYSPDA